MTELLQEPLEVRTDAVGRPVAVRRPGWGWRRVERITNHWLVETDWWRTPVRRHYHRLLLSDEDCIEMYRELGDDSWHLSRRYD